METGIVFTMKRKLVDGTNPVEYSNKKKEFDLFWCKDVPEITQRIMEVCDKYYEGDVDSNKDEYYIPISLNFVDDIQDTLRDLYEDLVYNYKRGESTFISGCETTTQVMGKINRAIYIMDLFIMYIENRITFQDLMEQVLCWEEDDIDTEFYHRYIEDCVEDWFLDSYFEVWTNY